MLLPAALKLILDLVGHADTTARVIFWSDTLGGRRAVAEFGLQLQPLGQIHVNAYLTRPGGAFFHAHIHPTGHIATRLNAGAGILRTRCCTCGGATAADRQAVQSERLLDPGHGIEARPAAAPEAR